MKRKKEISSLSSDELYEMLKEKKSNKSKGTKKSLTTATKKKVAKEKKISKEEEKQVLKEDTVKKFKSDKAMVTGKQTVDNSIVKKILSGEYVYFSDVDKEYEKIDHDDDFEGFNEKDKHNVTKVVSEARFNSDYHESLVDDDEFGTVRMNRKIDDSRIIDKSLDKGKWYKDIDKTQKIDTIIDVNTKKKYKIRWSAVFVTLFFIILFIFALIYIVWI